MRSVWGEVKGNKSKLWVVPRIAQLTAMGLIVLTDRVSSSVSQVNTAEKQDHKRHKQRRESFPLRWLKG